MRLKTSTSILRYLLTGLTGGLLLVWFPLVQQLHYESAFLATLVGSFWMMVWACRGAKREQFAYVTLTLLGVAIPLLIRSIIEGCLSWHGAALWILLPLPSVWFTFALGRLIRRWKLPHTVSWGVVIWLWIAAGVWLIEFYTLPQVHFFNHLWGWFPGPIYDQVIEVTPSVVAYRFLTVIWGIFFWYLQQLDRDRGNQFILLLCALTLLVGYSQLVNLNILTPRSELKKTLTHHNKSGSVHSYADSKLISDEELLVMDRKLEVYRSWLADTLNLDQNSKEAIEAYVYRHAWQKKGLVGAKFTSYVPVWLSQPQLHIAEPEFSKVGLHEMVHIVAKEFGNSLFDASWNIGLVEGLAVALSENRSEISTIDQMAASDTSVISNQNMIEALSFSGFYQGRSTVGYTVMGSFVRWLLREYPVSYFKQAYAQADLETAYQQSIYSLLNGWKNYLNTVPVDTIDRKTAQRYFSVPSLFEKACPHQASTMESLWDQYELARAEEDTTKTLQLLNQIIDREPMHPTTLNHWMYWNLVVDQQNQVIKRWNQYVASRDSIRPTIWLRAADAYYFNEDTVDAKAVIEKMLGAYPEYRQSDQIRIRANGKTWSDWLKLIYKNQIPTSIERPNLNRPVILEQTALNVALENRNSDWVHILTNRFNQADSSTRYWTFGLSLRTSEYLLFRDHADLGYQTLEVAKQLIQRPRDNERWEQLNRLVKFLE